MKTHNCTVGMRIGMLNYGDNFNTTEYIASTHKKESP
jgi:hypothetical protein